MVHSSDKNAFAEHLVSRNSISWCQRVKSLSKSEDKLITVGHYCRKKKPQDSFPISLLH